MQEQQIHLPPYQANRNLTAHKMNKNVSALINELQEKAIETLQMQINCSLHWNNV